MVPVVIGMLFCTSSKAQKKKHEDIPFAKIEQTAVFPGCEVAKNNEKAKRCFVEKVNQYISKNMNTGLADDLGLTGVIRMAAMFKIDKNGRVSYVKVKSKYPVLTEEFRRVLENLPQMQPAIHEGEKVNLLFSLPLVFRAGNEIPEAW